MHTHIPCCMYTGWYVWMHLWDCGAALLMFYISLGVCELSCCRSFRKLSPQSLVVCVLFPELCRKNFA